MMLSFCQNSCDNWGLWKDSQACNDKGIRRSLMRFGPQEFSGNYKSLDGKNVEDMEIFTPELHGWNRSEASV